MDLEPTHEDYDAVVNEALSSGNRLGQVILRAGTERTVYQVWEEFKLADDKVQFDIWEGTPPKFVPAPISREPFSSLEPVVTESGRDLIEAFRVQSQYPLEIISEQDANSFSFPTSGPSGSDLLVFGSDEAKEALEDWIREFTFDRVHQYLEKDDLLDAYDLLGAFHDDTKQEPSESLV